MSLFDLTVQDSIPAELYEFYTGAESHRYTDGTIALSHDVSIYEPEYISRSAIVNSEDLFKSTLSITFSRTNEFAQSFLHYTSEVVTTLTIYRGQLDSTTPGPFSAYWKGRVIAGKATDSEITLDCESIFTSVKRAGLRQRYELQCHHALYDHMCNVDLESFRFDDVVFSVTDNSNFITTSASSYPDGYFIAGMAKIGDHDIRFIANQIGDSITVTKPFSTIAPGTPIVLYPGCDHSKEACRLKFDNYVNFGGFPWIPLDNPFRLSSIV